VLLSDEILLLVACGELEESVNEEVLNYVIYSVRHLDFPDPTFCLYPTCNMHCCLTVVQKTGEVVILFMPSLKIKGKVGPVLH
jgi:hypothetical protein